METIAKNDQQNNLISSIDDQLLKKLNLSIKQNPQSDLDSCRFILLRHAFSQFQFIWESHKAEVGGSQLDGDVGKTFRFDPALADCSLHEIGVQQALYQQQFVNKIDFEIVFVSPLQRVLETTCLVFNSHPNKQNIRFVIVPSLSENIGLICSYAIGTNDEVRQKYEIEKKNQGFNFDFSLMDQFKTKMLWQFEQLTDEELRNRILEKFEKIKASRELIMQEIIQQIKEIYPQHIEKKPYTYLRTQNTTKNTIYNYLQNYYERQKPGLQSLTNVTNQKKIGIVSHSNILNALTSTKYEEGKLNGLKFKNCQLTPYKLDIEEKLYQPQLISNEEFK